MKLIYTRIIPVLAICLCSGCNTVLSDNESKSFTIKQIILNDLIDELSIDEVLQFSLDTSTGDDGFGDYVKNTYSRNYVEGKYLKKNKRNGTIVDIRTGGEIVEFSVAIVSIDASTSVVLGSWSWSSVSAGVYRYKIVLLNGSWQIVERALEVVA